MVVPIHSPAETITHQVHDVVAWRLESGYLAPGYLIAADHAAREVVVVVRGTRHGVDLLTDLASAHPYMQVWKYMKASAYTNPLTRNVQPLGSNCTHDTGSSSFPPQNWFSQNCNTGYGRHSLGVWLA
jgi:hypothetical protein